MVSSHENSPFVFRLAYLVDEFQQFNKINLKLQKTGRPIVDFIDTLSAFVEKLDNWKRKSQAGNSAVCENLATAAGDEVNVDIASEVVQHLGAFCHKHSQGAMPSEMFSISSQLLA